MKHHRRFWDEVLIDLEESLAAFSGVNLDLIDAPAKTPKICCGDSSRFGSTAQTSRLCTRRRDSETRSKTTN
jgi:hypothetical protein